MLQHQFDQLKEEMVSKEAALAREAQEQQRLIKEKEELAAEVDRSREETAAVQQAKREMEKNLGMVSDRHR